MTSKTLTMVSSVIFLIQITIQYLATYGIIELKNTTIQHEDLISTLFFCTFMIVYAIDKKESR